MPSEHINWAHNPKRLCRRCPAVFKKYSDDHLGDLEAKHECVVRQATAREKKTRKRCVVSEEVFARYRARVRGTDYKGICDLLGVEVPEAGMWTEFRESGCEANP